MKFFSVLSLFISLTFISLGFVTNGDETNKSIQKQEATAPSFCMPSPHPTVIKQSDGTEITILGKGNMNNYWTETTDGYTIVRNKSGVYEYADKLNGDLIASGVKARNVGARSFPELAHLNTISKSLKPAFNPLKASVLNQVNAQLQNKTYPTTGNIKVLALLIEYTDFDSSFAKEDFDSLLYGDNFRNGDGSFKNFYETSSNGQLTLEIDVEGWYESDSSYIHYGADSGYDKAADLVREAVDQAETAGVDFSKYDNDNDGDVDGILAIHAGPGAEVGSKTEFIWSHRWVLSAGNLGEVTYDGVVINDYMINPETRISGTDTNLVGIGVICHEFGHNLGLPDLYDTGDDTDGSAGIGEWGLMAGATYLGDEHRPGDLCAWAKVDLGWDTPTQLTIGESGEYTLPAASENQDAIFQINTSLDNEYFLLENRQKTGLDSDLRGEGLAIFHINTDKTNSSGNRVNADENKKGVDLEEADGFNDLDLQNNRGDDGDLFPGSENNQLFDDASNPSAKIDTNFLEVDKTNSNLQIRNIKEINDTIYFSFGPAPGPPCSGPDTLKLATDTFTDGSGNTAYAHNQSCSWLIEAAIGTITLDFLKFRTEAINDSLTIYDGNDATASVLANYSGIGIPASVTSTGAEMYLEFNTNNSINDSGWTASYTVNAPALGCGSDTLTAAKGKFTDGSGAMNYDNDLSCTWLIQPVGVSTITFGLDSLNTEITNDKITVYDGVNSSAPILGSYSGTNNLNTLTSTGGSLFVKFETNGSITNKGWQANYTSSINGPGCSGATTFTANSGSFSDGSGTANYDNNQFCTWLINPSSGQINLEFTAFETQNTFDRVIVFDGMDQNATQIGSYSGTAIPSVITSSSNALYLEFRTDGDTTFQGWDAEYSLVQKATCSGDDTLIAPFGTVTDGSGTNNYADTLNCTWLIQPPNATSIDIEFKLFELENGNDSLIIYNGTDASGIRIGAYTGQSVPITLSINSGDVFIEFITNNTINDKGWEFEYFSNPICSGTTTLTTGSGTFSDGSGSRDYGNDLDCSWLIQPSGSPDNIILSVNKFDVSTAFQPFPSFTRDLVQIYDNASGSGFPIASLFGAFIPSTVTSTTGVMLVKFTTDTRSVDEGWEFSYNSSETLCPEKLLLTQNTGNFTDGSAVFNQDYENDSDCSWLIEPSEPNRTINLNFTTFGFQRFRTELNKDSVVVYDGPTTSAPVLRTISGTPSSIAAINSTGGSMLVTFQSDGSGTDDGWRASYTTTVNKTCNGLTTLNAFQSGTFDDGSTDGIEYTGLNNCSWLIQPPGANVVTLSFNRFDTESGKDVVTVYDGTNAFAPSLGTFSGSNIPSQLTSSGASLFVEFKTDANINKNGWEASYNSSSNQCVSNSTLIASNDTLEDGSGTANYDNNLNCNWLIQPITATTVTLTFTALDLATADSVIVYDGVNNSAARLGAFSGNTIPTSITSTNGEMFLEFETDGNTTAAGWKAYYDITSSKSCIGSATLTANSGTIFDGSGTSSYDNNLSCSWLIQPTNNPVGIVFTMDSISLANNGDFVNVYDGIDASGTLLGTFFNGIKNSVIANSGSMFVEFITDQIAIGKGWGASYVTTDSYCAPNTTLTGINGAFTDGSPTQFDDYLNNTDCSWLIQPAGGKLAVSLRFSRFATQRNVDSVTIYDGSTTADPILQTFSGRSTSTVNSTGNSMLVTFKTDGASTSDGWRASYLTFPLPECSGQSILTAVTDTFNDGSADGSNYGPNSKCEWLIEPIGAVSIDLDFIRFATQLNLDVVTVYDGNSTSDPVLGTYSGLTVPSTTLKSTGGSILVAFSSNPTFQLNGWEIEYSSTNQATLSSNKDTVTINAGSGSSGSFDVTSNTSWTVSDNQNWLIATPFNGSSNQTVNVQAIQANIGPARYAEVYLETTIGGTKDTVIVEQLSSGRYLLASPNTLYFDDIPLGSQNIDLQTNVSWTLSTSASWLTLGSTSGTNNETVSVTAQDNTSKLVRTATIVASGNLGASNDTVFVVQDTTSAPSALSVNPSILSLNQLSGSIDSFMVNSNVVWQASTPATWLTLNLPSTTSDTAQVKISASSSNTGATIRSSFIAIQDVNGSLFDTVFVNQLGTAIQLFSDPDTVILSSFNGATTNVLVTANTNWVATEGDPWFSVSPGSGSTSGTITLTANSANSLPNQRISFLEIANALSGLYDTVVVIQDTNVIGLTASVDTIRITAGSGSSNNFGVSTDFGWIATPKDSWLSVSPSSFTGSTNLTATSNSANPTANERITYISIEAISGAVYNDTVYVIQDGSLLELEVNPSSVNLGFASGSNESITVSSNLNWTVSNPVNWLTVSKNSGTNDDVITVTTASANLTGASRTAGVTFSANGVADKILTVTQIDGSSPVFEVSQDTVFVENPQGSTASFSVLTNQINWTLTEITPWLLINPDSGSNTARITALVASRNIVGTARYAEITASVSGFPDKPVIIAQKGTTPLFQIAPDSIYLGHKVGNTNSFNISSNMLSWKIEENESWMSVTPDSGGFTSKITVEATEENASGNQKTGTITISSPPLVPKTVVVTQDTAWAIGIDEISLVESTNLYPNPTSGNITLDFGNSIDANKVQYSVFNLVGEEMTVSRALVSDNKIQLNLSSLAKGIYFVRLTYEGNLFTKKVLLVK